MGEKKKIYFASDLHLGAPDQASSLIREKHFVQWLEEIRQDAAELWLLGDIFDFWFEYTKAVPKGYLRLLGKLAELSDQGIPIFIFTGNHDLWMKNYLPDQIGAEIYRKPQIREFFGKTFFLAHGDGLGPGDHGYKFIKKVFTNPVCRWLFHRLHPNFGIGLANFFSRQSRKKTGHRDAIDHGEKEFLRIFTRDLIKEKPEIDYFVFGHRHLPQKLELEPDKFYINLGDWITHFTYLVCTEEGVELKHYPMPVAAEQPRTERATRD